MCTLSLLSISFIFFFQAEDGIRDGHVTGVQTCALPIWGGIHNSVTRTLIKPTHMIGGYAQLSYGFNYYGTVGSNRDEFVVIRKMNKVDWLEGDDESIQAQEYVR